MTRLLRVVVTLVVTALATAYVVWKIDVGETARILRGVDGAWLALTLALTLVTVWPMAWRWQLLLEATGIRDRVSPLVRAYFVSYAAGQILPTSIGGDAVRVYDTSRRHPGRLGEVAGSVVLERAIGAVATLALAGVGFALALGRYDVGAYLWLEGIFLVGAAVAGVVFFSRSMRGPLARLVPLLRRLWLERPLRALYEAIHAYRSSARVLLAVLAITLALQVARIFAIWTGGKAVGVDISPRVYFVMGPLLFLVLLFPFTLNGLAVREAFFVSFLGTLGVPTDHAFATGFVFFVSTVALAVPGGVVLAWHGVRGSPRPRIRHRHP